MAGPLGPATTEGRDDGLAAAESGGDRQVLVVGEGVGAVVAAAFLDQTGLDPVLAGRSRDRGSSLAVTVWQSGLDLLERIGLRRPVERRGTVLAWSGHESGSDPTDRPSLVAVAGSDLDALFDRRLLDRFRTTDRPVAAVASDDSGVRATFDDGVDELFDAVITTERRLHPEHEPARSRAVHAWTFPWPDGRSPPETPTEAWDTDRAAFAVPVGDTSVVRLVAAGGAASSDVVGVADLADRFGHLFDSTDPFPALDRGDLRYRRTPCATPASMRVDGVVVLGPGTRTSLPGDPLGTALTIEDAWVVADALAYGSGSVTDRLARYATRRRRREIEVVDACAGTGPDGRCPADAAPSMAHLCAARTVAFGRTGSVGRSLAVDVPDRL